MPALPFLKFLQHFQRHYVVYGRKARLIQGGAAPGAQARARVELTGEDHWHSRADPRPRRLLETARFLEVHNPPG